MSGVSGGEIFADIVSTTVPSQVANPHGRNSFAIADGRATEDEKHPGTDLEAVRTRSSTYSDEEYPRPTAEETAKLRKVADSIPLKAYLLCIVELAERASYYGVQTVFSNFMQFPLPEGGNGAGSPPRGTQETAGALGKGVQFSVAIGLLFLFLAYFIPIFGGYIADTKLGRFKTIMIGVLICGVSHVIMIGGAAPSVLQAGKGIVPFMLSLILLAIGAGIFKPCIAPTVIAQYEHQKAYVKTLPSGERVVVDPETTIQRIMLAFYAMINVGAFFAIATAYSEKYVGYWLAFLLPGIVYFLLPLLLLYLNKRLVKTAPDGSDLQNVWKIATVALRESKGKFWKSGFWNAARPSALASKGVTTFYGKPISWNDKAVDDVHRTLQACAVFLYFPIYNINDGGIGSVSTAQAAAMTTNGAPNDLLTNFNPLTIIVAVPILSYVVYPALRKRNIKFGRISRITVGFILAIASGIIGAIIQWRIYKTSPCGYGASDCSVGTGVSPISVWAQVPILSLGALSECLCNAYELPYARAPKGMKALVMSLFLFTTALSYALGEILTPVITDPHLIWVWGGPAIALAVQTVIFWYRYKDLNEDEFMIYDEDYENGARSAESIDGIQTSEGVLGERHTPDAPSAIAEEKEDKKGL